MRILLFVESLQKKARIGFSREKLPRRLDGDKALVIMEVVALPEQAPKDYKFQFWTTTRVQRS
jgi:hypothetical protein